MNPLAATGIAIRSADAAALALALRACRGDTLATFDDWGRSMADRGWTVPARADLNPPLWELGHIGWFQEYWIARNPERGRGAEADPEAPRARALRADADRLFDSGKVPHATRWSLPLPGADAIRDDLAAQLEATLALLRDADSSDDALYFFRLVLLHEDMHHEASLYMAQSLGLPLDTARSSPAPMPAPRRLLDLAPASHRLGSAGDGFAFDNELRAHEVALDGFAIDSQVVCWDEFLPFVDEGGYETESFWTDAGRRWRSEERADGPLHLKRAGGEWRQWRFGRWHALDRRLPG